MTPAPAPAPAADGVLSSSSNNTAVEGAAGFGGPITSGPYSPSQQHSKQDAASTAARALVLGNEPLLRHVHTHYLSLQDQLLHVRSVCRCVGLNTWID